MSKVKILSKPVGRPAATLQPMIDWMEEFGNWIISWMEQHDKARPGGMVDSLSVSAIQNPQFVSLEADKNLIFALTGRKSGKKPPMQNILDWLNRKNGYASGDDSLRGIAFYIQKQIGENGTQEPKLRVQNIKLVLEQLGKKHFEKLGRNLSEEIAESVIKSMTKSKYIRKV